MWLYLACPSKYVFENGLNEPILSLRLVPGIHLTSYRSVPPNYFLEGYIGLLTQFLDIVATGKPLLQVVIGEETAVVNRRLEEGGGGHQ